MWLAQKPTFLVHSNALKAGVYNNHLFCIWIDSTPLSVQKIILNIHDANEESIKSTESP